MSFPRRLSIALEAVIIEINIRLGLNITNIFSDSLYEEPNTRSNPMGINTTKLKIALTQTEAIFKIYKMLVLLLAASLGSMKLLSKTLERG